MYSTYSIGNIINGVFVSDEGLTYNVTEQTCEGRIDTMKRAFIVCDVLEKTSGKDNAFNIRLRDLHSVLVKDVLYSDKVEEDVIGTNPISLTNGWVSKGYLNIYFHFTYFAESTKKHFINLVVDKEKSTENNIVLELRHNGYGETLDKASDGDLRRVKVGQGYASFKIDDIIPEGMDKITATINWVWHSQIGNVIDKETVPMSTTGVLSR